MLCRCVTVYYLVETYLLLLHSLTSQFLEVDKMEHRKRHRNTMPNSKNNSRLQFHNCNN
nr:MAG TPA: hypothetical protein [Caudoviricetes sp.]